MHQTRCTVHVASSVGQSKPRSFKFVSNMDECIVACSNLRILTDQFQSPSNSSVFVTHQKHSLLIEIFIIHNYVHRASLPSIYLLLADQVVYILHLGEQLCNDKSLQIDYGYHSTIWSIDRKSIFQGCTHVSKLFTLQRIYGFTYILIIQLLIQP